MPAPEALTRFYTDIFKGRPRRRRALYGDPLADLQKYGGKHGMVPIRKDDDGDDEVAVDDDSVRRLVDQDQDDEADDEDDSEQVEQTKHLVSDLADLCVEASEGQTDRPTALRALLHTARGNALVHRLRAAQKRLQKKEQKAMPKWEDIAKVDGGGDAIADHVLNTVAKGGTTTLDQNALTKYLTVAAQRQYPNLRPDVAFAKAYESNENWRRAMQHTKAFPQMMSVEPVFVGGAAAQDVNDPRDAYAQLQALAAEQRKRAPFMTAEQAFAAIYSDPANAELANAERRQSRARLTATLPSLPG